ncbi:MAG: surfeit locus 1 family protein [Methylophilaceae bacterium]|jgi:surfeit locus 1 family protein|tara:strand:- start:42994 stop:43719 length:726 start_codon:yes stop_codon:yes gene_type:complete
MRKYLFKPKLFMTIATLLVMTLCIRLGFWQYDKAQERIVAQGQIDQGLEKPPVQLSAGISDNSQWRYKRVTFKGTYMPEYEILLDNRVHNTKAGYQIVTPVKVVGEEAYVMVNRGWIEGNLNREAPVYETPTGEYTFVGDLFFPLDKVFTLEVEHSANVPWLSLWQHINMPRYQSLVPFKVKPYMVRLAPSNAAGGFVREWPVPKNRITLHLGYAYQWFGFAFTFFVIYIVLNLKQLKKRK